MNIRGWAPLIALVALTAGCGGGTVAGSPSSEASSAGGAAAPGAAPAAAGIDVSACSLLKPAEVQALIGANDGGKGTTSDRSLCTWTTPDDLSVTVDVAARGTAPNGLPAWDPTLGPERPLADGMRALDGEGNIEFVAGTRDCTIQVATDPPSKDDDNQAIQLAKLVQSRL